jgi:hypothetical protein
MKTYKTLIIDNSTIKIYRKFEKKLNLYRYSYDIQTSIGWMANGGFGLNNQITHPTYESILTSTLQVLNIPKETIRDYKLTLLEENDTKPQHT